MAACYYQSSMTPKPKLVCCLNGHVVHTSHRVSMAQIRALSEASELEEPEKARGFCGTCGARTINACPGCQAPIEGCSKPAYCSGCGTPFPWQASGIENLRAVLEEVDLTAEDRDELDSVLPDVVRDTPKSESAALRMKRVLSKVGKPLYDVALKVATDVASETAKKTLGLK